MIEIKYNFFGRTIDYRADTDDPVEAERRAFEYASMLVRDRITGREDADPRSIHLTDVATDGSGG